MIAIAANTGSFAWDVPSDIAALTGGLEVVMRTRASDEDLEHVTSFPVSFEGEQDL